MESAFESSPVVEQTQSEKRLETGKKVFQFLNRTGFLDIRKSDEQFDEWMQNLSYDDFSSYLTRLNGILRDVPTNERTVDGGDGKISLGTMGDVSYLPPITERKDGMMRETFNALKQVSSKEDRALLAYYALQAIHPYSDGNGRTGRLLYEILSENGKSLTEDGLSNLLDHETEGHGGTGKGRDIFAEKVMKADSAYYYINREVAGDTLGEDFIKEYGSIYIAAPMGVAYVPEDVKNNLSSEESLLVERILGEADVRNFSFRGIVLAKLIGEKPELQRYLLSRSDRLLDRSDGVVPEDIGKRSFRVDGENFMSELTQENAKRLMEIHREVKDEFIRAMIDIFVHPQQHHIKTVDGSEVTLNTIFRKRTRGHESNSVA